MLAACGNGSIRLFDITLQGLPVQAWHEHHAEVVCADWSNIEKRMFATASWDGVAKVVSTLSSCRLTVADHPMTSHETQLRVWKPSAS